MDLAGRTPRARKEPLSPGEHVFMCLSAVEGVSAAGNKMIVWELECNGVILRHFTVKRRVETGLMVQALALPKRFKLSDAVGQECRATVSKDGAWLKVTAVRPL